MSDVTLHVSLHVHVLITCTQSCTQHDVGVSFGDSQYVRASRVSEIHISYFGPESRVQSPESRVQMKLER